MKVDIVYKPERVFSEHSGPVLLQLLSVKPEQEIIFLIRAYLDSVQATVISQTY